MMSVCRILVSALKIISTKWLIISRRAGFYGATLNPSKFQFSQKEVELVGCNVGKKDIKLLDNNLVLFETFLGHLIFLIQDRGLALYVKCCTILSWGVWWL